jgi:hypothetical protein
MKTLAEMEEMAQRDESLRQFLIIHKTLGPMNGKFLDPFLGLIQLKLTGDPCIQINELDKFNTTGIFI